jgi:hypothetical protein
LRAVRDDYLTVSSGTFSGTPYTPDPYGGEWAEGGQNIHTDPESHRGWWLPLPDEFPRSVHTEGYAISLLVASGPCRLFGFQGYDANTSGEFIQVFDKTSVGDIATGAHPTFVLSTGTAAGNFSVYFGTAGRWMQRGCVIAASSTGPTYTAAASLNMYVDAQYA